MFNQSINSSLQISLKQPIKSRAQAHDNNSFGEEENVTYFDALDQFESIEFMM